mmetsp:Transcript_4681/g.13105  ORF Transcript_4681/g.13105 Transcript_4681/m.13105 type:complete len:208 (-) Transcript_4681:830-1453(-)
MGRIVVRSDKGTLSSLSLVPFLVRQWHEIDRHPILQQLHRTTFQNVIQQGQKETVQAGLQLRHKHVLSKGPQETTEEGLILSRPFRQIDAALLLQRVLQEQLRINGRAGEGRCLVVGVVVITTLVPILPQQFLVLRRNLESKCVTAHLDGQRGRQQIQEAKHDFETIGVQLHFEGVGNERLINVRTRHETGRHVFQQGFVEIVAQLR